jgi:hypothetical protein
MEQKHILENAKYLSSSPDKKRGYYSPPQGTNPQKI